jgi:16S rRNA (guanine966-N2)-methyltransferase
VRIIAGRWKGRTIQAPAGDRVRPTGDRAREAWMSIVNPLLPGARVLDLFAGSGALGLEALSRGAASADFVEIDAASLRAIRENGAHLGATENMSIHRADALRFVAKLEPFSYDVAFADPPYGQGGAARLAELWIERPFARLLGVEHEARDEMPAGGELRKYGRAAITIYRAPDGSTGGPAAEPVPPA